MKLCRTVSEWREAQTQYAKRTIGFVPTMGNLHRGHASLLQTARAENDVVVLSIYVNPTQFNDADDFKHYPKTLDADLALAKSLGVDVVLLPDTEMMYPDHFQFQVSDSVESTRLEGCARPGHFTGMLTIVLKLLVLIGATRAYLGEKDYQQAQLVRQLVKAFFITTEICICPTVREASKLALSSRNQRLNQHGRALADEFATRLHETASLEELRQALSARGIAIDYLEDVENRRFAAVTIDGVRLIDNIALSRGGV